MPLAYEAASGAASLAVRVTAGRIPLGSDDVEGYLALPVIGTLLAWLALRGAREVARGERRGFLVASGAVFLGVLDVVETLWLGPGWWIFAALVPIYGALRVGGYGPKAR